MQIELLPTSIDQWSLLANLYQFYAYESSDWEQEDVEADGRFYIHEPHLRRYWSEPGWSASLILADGLIAGFLLIERSEIPGLDAQEFADLFVLKRYRHLGIGRAIARQMLGDGRTWLVRFYRQDLQAAAFWESVLAQLPARRIEPDDQHTLLSYLIAPTAH